MELTEVTVTELTEFITFTNQVFSVPETEATFTMITSRYVDATEPPGQSEGVSKRNRTLIHSGSDLRIRDVNRLRKPRKQRRDFVRVVKTKQLNAPLARRRPKAFGRIRRLRARRRYGTKRRYSKKRLYGRTYKNSKRRRGRRRRRLFGRRKRSTTLEADHLSFVSLYIYWFTSLFF